MTAKEKALAAIRQRRKEAMDKHSALLDSLRSDSTFDAFFRAENAMKWEYVKAQTDKEKEEIDKKISDNREAMNVYLSKLGYTEDVFSVPYTCDVCQDSGVFDGKECSCVERTRIEIALRENPLLSACPFGFKELSYDVYGEERAGKEKIVRGVEQGMKNGRKFFLFAGKPGTGKTFLACTAVNELLKQGRDVLALPAVKWNKMMLSYHCAALEEKERMWKEIAETDVLFIDDLGAEQVLNNVTIPYLLELLTDRTEKVTFITTNLSPADLEKRYGQRILSRLLDKNLSMPIVFSGKDLRFS